MKLTVTQRSFIADKLMDSANYALAGLVFGQLVANQAQPVLFGLGLLIYLAGWATALRLRGEAKSI